MPSNVYRGGEGEAVGGEETRLQCEQRSVFLSSNFASHRKDERLVLDGWSREYSCENLLTREEWTKMDIDMQGFCDS